MASDGSKSRNAIPPRRSSIGRGGTYIHTTKPVLKAVSEGDWISKGKMPQTQSLNSSDPGPAVSVNGIVKHAYGTTWPADNEKILLGPYDYMVDHPGKDIRKQFIAAFNAWLKVPEESLVIITKVVGMLHTASLLYVWNPILFFCWCLMSEQCRRCRGFFAIAPGRAGSAQHLWHSANDQFSQLRILWRIARAAET